MYVLSLLKCTPAIERKFTNESRSITKAQKYLSAPPAETRQEADSKGMTPFFMLPTETESIEKGVRVYNLVKL